MTLLAPENDVVSMFQIQTATVTLKRLAFHSANAPAGAVLQVLDSVLNIYNCIFENNTAFEAGASGGGGAVLLSGLSTAQFFTTTFTDNAAVHNGGAVAVRITPNSQLGQGSVSFYDCKFIRNTAVSAGAVEFSTALSLNMQNCVFSNNSASAGGALRIQPAVQTVHRVLKGCIFEFNAATTGPSTLGGGAVYVLDAPTAFVQSSTQLLSCTFLSNSASLGGAVQAAATYHTLDFQDCTFSRNSAANSGLSSVANGGALWLKSPVQIVDCRFNNNLASATLTSSGGAIYHRASSSYHTLSILDSVFESNSAFMGGALNIDGYAASQTISKTSFESNTGTDPMYTGTEMSAGGAALASNSNADFLECKFVSNNASRAGAILVSGASASVAVTLCNFDANQALSPISGGLCLPSWPVCVLLHLFLLL